MKSVLLLYFFCIAASINVLYSQVKEPQDSFFLLKKKGLLKRLGQSIYRENVPDAIPVKAINPFVAYKGFTIRSVRIAPTGFNKIIRDTLGTKKTFASDIADAFHKNTLPDVINKNLFFRAGDKVLPLLISDNERFLRDLPFLKDAIIVLEPTAGADSMVDAVIITRDVFSIGGSLSAGSLHKGKLKIREENFGGSGNTIEGSLYYERDRKPNYGKGASFIIRNIRHSFINWSAGVNTFNPAFNSGRRELTSYYTAIEKPLVSRYSQWTATAVFAIDRTNNAYLDDSLYRVDFQYRALTADLWAGYNIGARNRKERDMGQRLRHFVALRSFYNNFFDVPQKFSSVYNYSYANINGLLASYSLYRQNFYRTNFIYGFGRNEDIPSGVNATAVSGYTNKQGIKRGYIGLEFDATHYSERGYFTGYTFRSGGSFNSGKLRDVDLLIGFNRFTKLFTLSNNWRNRNFFSVNLTRQFSTVLNAPLFLESSFGLPYFRFSTDAADARATLKGETVFYNLKKIAGFRFAPFLFGDASFLKPMNKSVNKTNGYTAIGGGIRTRNENLTFGTIELRGYYFPRVNQGMKNYKIEIGTNLKFRYNSSFIRRPDFVSGN